MKSELTASEIKKFNKGDVRVYDKLFTDYYPQIYYFCKRLTRNTHEGEDIAVKVFSKLWEDRQKFDSERFVYNFLYATARNACIDYLRNKKSHQEFTPDMANQFADDEKKIQNDAEYLAIIYEEIEQLPERVREVFKLSYFGGLSNKEIADILNISTNNVSVTKNTAIKILRMRLHNKTDLFIMAFLISLTENLPN